MLAVLSNDPRQSGRGGCGLVTALVLVTAICGCASPPNRGEAAEPGRRVVADSANETRGKIGRAERMSEDGDHGGALEALTAALRTADDSCRDRIQELRLEVKQRILAEVLEARVHIAAKRMVVGKPLVITLELVNRGSETVTVPWIDYRSRLIFFRKEIGRTQFDLRFELQNYDAGGAGRRERFNRHVEPEDDIVVLPGATWTRTIELPSDGLRPQTEFSARLSARLLRRLEVEVVIRPVQLLLGERDFYTSIRFAPAVVYLLPRGSEPIFEDPLRHLELALLRSAREPRFIPNILVAASLIEGEKRKDGKALLVRFRDEGAPGLRPVAVQALELFWPAAAGGGAAKDGAVTFKPLDR